MLLFQKHFHAICLHGVQGVVSSNPTAPTNKTKT
jgi:hypothetical protein